MMLAQVRGIYTIDHDDLEAYVPNDPVECHMVVRLMVGPHDGEGEESFDVTVCTPAWLGPRCEERGAVIGRHYLIVGTYDPNSSGGSSRNSSSAAVELRGRILPLNYAGSARGSLRIIWIGPRKK